MNDEPALPIVFGRHFRLNIVLTLMILFIGGSFFGVWGVILGIPVANYIIRDVIAVPMVGEMESVDSAPASIAIKPGDQDKKKFELKPEEPTKTA